MVLTVLEKCDLISYVSTRIVFHFLAAGVFK